MDPAKNVDPHDLPHFSSALPASPSSQPPPIAMRDTAEEFHEEEDKLNYPVLNELSLSLPFVACPEKIIICMDPSMETAGKYNCIIIHSNIIILFATGHVLKSKEGSNQESLINICKNALEMFICTKSAIDKRHQFGLMTLFNTAAWTRDPTNAKDDIIRDMRHLDPTDVEDIFDLTSLFTAVQHRVK